MCKTQEEEIIIKCIIVSETLNAIRLNQEGKNKEKLWHCKNWKVMTNNHVESIVDDENSKPLNCCFKCQENKL